MGRGVILSRYSCGDPPWRHALTFVRTRMVFSFIRTSIAFPSMIQQVQSVKTARLNAIVGYSDVATNTLLVFDYLIMFPQEVELIWKARWNFAKVIYLVARYSSFSALVPALVRYLHRPSPSLCSGLNLLIVWSAFVSYTSGEIIFTLRTAAIWEHSRRIVFTLVGVYTLLMGTQFSLNVTMTTTILNMFRSSQPTDCRLGTPNHTLIYIALSCLLMFETVVGILTLIKALDCLRQVEISRVPLLVALYRDGILFYVYTAAISLANIIVVALAPDSCLRLVFGLQRVLHSILSVRVMLHLREARENTEYSWGELSMRRSEGAAIAELGALETPQRGGQINQTA